MRQFWFKKGFDKIYNYDDSLFLDKNLELGMSNGIESIWLQNIIRANFSKRQSKISLQICSGYLWKYIYFNKDNQTLEIFDDWKKKYYFDIEFDSEINELLETTQFKIRVDE